MKKIILLGVIIYTLFIPKIKAQIPSGFNYQAVIRSSDGNLMQQSDVSIRISILQGITATSVIYTETHAAQTNSYGLINLVIGEGQTSDNFSSIDWSNSPYFIKLEVDLNDGSGYVEIGTSQLLSVPYALHAKTVENDQVNDADNDPENELQVLSISNDTIYLTQGSFVKLPASSVPQQFSVSEFGDTLYLSNGNSIVIPGISVYNFNYPKLGVYFEESNKSKFANSVVSSDDNIICLSTNDNGDFIISKIDTLGQNVWTKSFHIDTINYVLYGNIKKTNDNGYITTWYYNGSDPGYPAQLLVKYSVTGDTIWARSYKYSDIYQLSDDNYLTSFATEDYKAVLVKLSSTGDTLWTKQYDFLNNEYSRLNKFFETSDGGFLFIAGGPSEKLIKTDNIGDTIWTKSLNSYSNFINETSDNKYIIGGGTKAIKINPDKSIIWEKDYKPDYSYIDYIINSFCLSNGDIILIGYSEINGNPVPNSNKLGETDIWYLHINSSGEVITSRYYGGSLDDSYINSFMLSSNRILIISESDSYNGYVPNSALANGVWIFTIGAE